MGLTEDLGHQSAGGNGSVAGDTGVSPEARAARAVEEYLAELEAGRRPDRHAFVARHPDIAELLEKCFESLEFVRSAGAQLEPSAGDFELQGTGKTGSEARTLGDFQIVREIGRGGMGIVYEATQLSLNRRVALKVLPFAAVMDSKRLQRFKNEAQAAGQMHHTSIVPVFFVGCDRGVHYFAMQYIEGQTLGEVIRELRRTGRSNRDMAANRSSVNDESVPGLIAPQPGDESFDEYQSPSSTFPVAALATDFSTKPREFFRAVAQLGIQAAEALDHAHELGILHRDIKPSNLLIDVRGRLWITDFGLARVQTDANLTVTGDLMGTLRYMSPEQALAKRVVVDHRTDIYSLGVTLYELLTLEPAFANEDPAELLRQIAFDEPQAPRRVNARVPVELETIVLKACAKNPSERYATARELAEDLDRFLREEPIWAKRPTLAQRVRKWSRRHKAIVWSAAICVIAALVSIGGAAGWTWIQTKQQELAQQAVVQLAFQDSEKLQDLGKYREALRAILQAELLVRGFETDSGPFRRLQHRRADLELATKLEKIRFQSLVPAGDSGRLDMSEASEAYQAAFQGAGLPVNENEVEETAQRIRATSVSIPLAVHLDDWAYARKFVAKRGDTGWKYLLEVAIRVDPDPIRTRIRNTLLSGDRQGLIDLALDPTGGDLPPLTAWHPATLCRLAAALPQKDPRAVDAAITLLRQAQRTHRDDFWIQFDLGFRLLKSKPTPENIQESIRFFNAASALRPDAAVAQINLGVAFSTLGNNDQAIECFRDALAAEPDWAITYQNLGLVYRRKQAWQEAEAAYRKAIEIEPRAFGAHMQLGNMMCETNRWPEAVPIYEQALKIRPDDSVANFNLGVALRRNGDNEKALEPLRNASRLKPDYAKAFFQEGEILIQLSRRTEAVAPLEKFCRLAPSDADGHVLLGVAYSLDREAEAIQQFREALKIVAQSQDQEASRKSRTAINATNSLSLMLANAADTGLHNPAEALKLAETNVALQDSNYMVWFALGLAQYRAERYPDAIQSLERSGQLRPKGPAPEALFLLASAHAQLGAKPAALEHYHRALNMMSDGDHNDASTVRLRTEATSLLRLELTPPVAN